MLAQPVMRLPQPLGIGDSPTHVGLTLTGLTPTRLVQATANKALASASLSAWIAGMANRVTVADNGVGGVTISGPQNIHTGAVPTFLGLTISGDSSGQTVGIAGGVSILRASGVALTVRQDSISSGNETALFQHDSSSTGRYVLRAQKDAAGVPTDIMTLEAAGRMIVQNSLGIGGASPSTGIGVLGIKAVTAPSVTLADSALVYVADIAAGQAAVHILNESGSVIKLYRQAFVASPGADLASLKTAVDAIRTLLINNGLMAAS